MFTGLTNQVSTWMGKKGEDAGTELPTEEAKLPTGAEGGEDPDRKDSPTRSMLVGVKSQMTGWFSGGIPGLSRGAGQGGDGESQAGKPMNGAQMAQNTESTVAEQTKDDDASSATGGADSGPASLEGSPSEDKEGQQAFGGVSTKALAGAKTLGGFLYSAVNKAGKTVVEAGAKIKKTVEENRLVAELNKEQEAFIANKHTEKGEAVAPWVGAPNEDILREECLSLSTDQRNFLKPPPKEVDFPWDFEAVQPMAQATLALDPNLENMRFQLVPKVISEENFWRNYFYRVSVLRQSHELNTMADQTENNLNQTSAGTVDQPEVQVTTGQESSGTAMTGSNSALADSPGHEFVSDSMRVSDTDLEEVREGMKKLGMQPPKEEDWERELEAELKDYEVVTGNEERNSNATPIRNSGALDKDDWEKQIDELLANEDDEDLK
ncbi:synapse-associated protein 1-like isoform X2 [Bombus vosnesenskii]|uniref:Synapse-associated protein 1-like isoform X2 n=3 Tax=Pyrobombus TaxID=144703 RepID=A0A6J3KJ14_9HYME|nr:synapse-associated protein 1 isoform X2 [Bombus impatiens]XP_033302246.1 synapse-associated protein 1 isoform X2 [Bombus bifarius]XP_033352266.1 synapse-associated protein 1-like isoform X2 [Bombus vosnesenskii]XP_050479612.1 synapse-associated protein 1-like isoform X2 [Bombus huntii]